MQLFDLFIILVSLCIGWFSTTGSKTQFVRLVDIFFYGPFLIYIGFQFDDLFIRSILFFMGSTTITYNLKNYIEAM
jgi:hypothetical protein